MELGTGQRINDRYVLSRPLKTRSYRPVWSARDVRAHRPVVLKLGDPDEREHFACEFAVSRTVRHPHVAATHDWGLVENGPLRGAPFLAMERVAGCPADAWPRPWRLDELVTLARQLLGALASIHARGWVHRDVKPDNVLVRRTADRVAATLIDFGLAVPQGEQERPGCISGSLAFVAPETILGHPAEPHLRWFP